MKRFAMDVTALSKINTGLGYYITNMLEGFKNLNADYRLYIIVGKTNKDLFDKYTNDKRIKIIQTDCPTDSKYKRVVWINLHLSKLLRKIGIYKCIEPYYCMPVFNLKKIRYYTTIHDLQALHYPEYLSKKQNIWLRFMWRLATRRSYKIMTISDYSKKDLERHYKSAIGKVKTIYIAVSVSEPDERLFNSLKTKYKIEESNYFYSVSKLRKNKNFGVLIEAYKKMLDNGKRPLKLLVSGNNGGDGQVLKQMIEKYNLDEYIILTGFISDEERNSLYKNARAFLFPSIFEGFGMTPVEAMALGTPVITTKCTSLYEVTQGKANYVNDPMDTSQWIQLMYHFKNNSKELDLNPYSLKFFANEVLNYIDEE